MEHHLHLHHHLHPHCDLKIMSSMHVLFMREHNRVAKLIGKYLPKNLQQDELIYQVNMAVDQRFDDQSRCSGDKENCVGRDAKHCLWGIPPNYTWGQVHEEVSIQVLKYLNTLGQIHKELFWPCLSTDHSQVRSPGGGGYRVQGRGAARHHQQLRFSSL